MRHLPGTRGSGLRLALVGISLLAVIALAAVRATAASTLFLLAFEGAHFVDSTLGGGVRHDGRFTASAPFCSAGRAYDVRHLDTDGLLNLLRLHTCDDGSGSFTAFMPNARAEHGGTGVWQIVEGTGGYATLRGVGTYTGTHISGDPNDFVTISYKTEWRGVVGFDADPPTVENFTATVRRIRQRVPAYTLRIALTGRDTSLPISYTLDLRAGQALLDFKRVSTASGRATITARVRPPRAARNVRILLTARDALGNETSTSRAIRLR
jgi:hypothetical protein